MPEQLQFELLPPEPGGDELASRQRPIFPVTDDVQDEELVQTRH